MSNRATVITDTETTGLDDDDHIWEFAAVRREPNGDETTYHTFLHHDLDKASKLPDRFRFDHHTRFDPAQAISLAQFTDLLRDVFVGTPYVVGAVPNFDTQRYTRILALSGQKPLWHYHLQDVENLAVGYLAGRAACGDIDAATALANAEDSNALSRALGVEPGRFERHTALGDVYWARAIYDQVHARKASAR